MSERARGSVSKIWKNCRRDNGIRQIQGHGISQNSKRAARLKHNHSTSQITYSLSRIQDDREHIQGANIWKQEVISGRRKNRKERSVLPARKGEDKVSQAVQGSQTNQQAMHRKGSGKKETAGEGIFYSFVIQGLQGKIRSQDQARHHCKKGPGEGKHRGIGNRNIHEL